MKASGEVEELNLGDSVSPEPDSAQLKALQAAVGGWVEALPLLIQSTPGLILWANEEGHRLNLQPNASATALASLGSVRGPILGDVVLTGSSDGHGGFKDIPEYWLRVFLNRKAENNA